MNFSPVAGSGHQPLPVFASARPKPIPALYPAFTVRP